MPTLEELADSLPNGFHDAEVHGLAVDLRARVARLELDVLVGEVDAPADAGRETYRMARLELRGLAYFVMEPPDPRYAYAQPGTVRVDLCDVDPTGSLPPTRSGDFSARFSVAEWNAFICVSAREAALEWVAAAVDRSAVTP